MTGTLPGTYCGTCSIKDYNKVLNRGPWSGTFSAARPAREGGQAGMLCVCHVASALEWRAG